LPDFVEFAKNLQQRFVNLTTVDLRPKGKGNKKTAIKS